MPSGIARAPSVRFFFHVLRPRIRVMDRNRLFCGFVYISSFNCTGRRVGTMEELFGAIEPATAHTHAHADILKSYCTFALSRVFASLDCVSFLLRLVSTAPEHGRQAGSRAASARPAPGSSTCPPGAGARPQNTPAAARPRAVRALRAGRGSATWPRCSGTLLARAAARRRRRSAAIATQPPG